jgi:hypothetical protein
MLMFISERRVVNVQKSFAVEETEPTEIKI